MLVFVFFLVRTSNSKNRFDSNITYGKIPTITQEPANINFLKDRLGCDFEGERRRKKDIYIYK